MQESKISVKSADLIQNSRSHVMKNKIDKSIEALLLILLISLFSCATTPEIQSGSGRRIIDMGSYSVEVPPGEGWKFELAREKGMVKFLKKIATEERGVSIQVFQNKISPDIWHLSEEQVANDFRNGEEKAMIEEGVKKSVYTLEDVNKEISTIGEKKVYSMSYKKRMRIGNKPYREVAVLYLYFPDNFKETHAFYCFLFADLHTDIGADKIDLQPVFAVINSLKITSQISNKPNLNNELFKAVAEGNIVKVKGLLEKGADANSGDNTGTVLMLAALKGYREIAKLLIEKGASVNATGKDGLTPLMRACASKHVDTVSVLLEAGANVNAKAKGGTTSLMFAAWYGPKETVEKLLAKGADINAKTDTSNTALDFALEQRQFGIAKTLIAAGVDVNSKGNRGRTCLMGEAYRGNADMVKLLLRAGANVNEKDSDGLTALKWAEKGGHKRIIQMLKEAGAKD